METALFIILGFIIGGGLTFGGFKYWITKHIKKTYISIETIENQLKKRNPKRGLFDTQFTWTDVDVTKNKIVKLEVYKG